MNKTVEYAESKIVVCILYHAHGHKVKVCLCVHACVYDDKKDCGM